MKRVFSFLDGASLNVSRLFVMIAGTTLVAMMLLACANVLLRTVGYPVRGTFEMMGFFGSIVASFALGKTYLSGEHIAVDVLMRRFPLRVKKILIAVNDGISAAFFCIAAWQVLRWGMRLQASHELSETLRIPFYPFVYGVSAGCGVLAFVLVIETIRSLTNHREV